jgi:antitoxin FitA
MYSGIMPVMLQVRNLPDDVHSKLKQRAKEARMSLSDYVARELVALVETKTLSEVLDWAATRTTGVKSGEVVEAIHAERKGRE